MSLGLGRPGAEEPLLMARSEDGRAVRDEDVDTGAICSHDATSKIVNKR